MIFDQEVLHTDPAPHTYVSLRTAVTQPTTQLRRKHCLVIRTRILLIALTVQQRRMITCSEPLHKCVARFFITGAFCLLKKAHAMILLVYGYR